MCPLQLATYNLKISVKYGHYQRIILTSTRGSTEACSFIADLLILNDLMLESLRDKLKFSIQVNTICKNRSFIPKKTVWLNLIRTVFKIWIYCKCRRLNNVFKGNQYSPEIKSQQ